LTCLFAVTELLLKAETLSVLKDPASGNPVAPGIASLLDQASSIHPPAKDVSP